MPQPRVRVVVLNYNGGEFIERTFAALEATRWPVDRIELIMIDNASTDDSRDLVAKRFPAVHIIDSPENAGFPANNLALRSLDDVDYVALINNDAFVEPDWLAPLVDALDADARRGAACPKLVLASRFVDLRLATPSLTKAPGDRRQLGAQLVGLRVDGRDVLASVSGTGVHSLETGRDGQPYRWTSPVGTVRLPVTDDPADDGPWSVELDACRVDGREPLVVTAGDHRVTSDLGLDVSTLRVVVDLDPYSLINNAGSVVLADGSGADRGFLQNDSDAFAMGCDVFAWCGGAVLFRPDYLRDVGLFDDRFFLYYEDTDLSWRGQLRGWSYRFVPESVVRHMHAATSVEGSPTFRHYTERNRLAMLTKNAPPGLALRAPLRFLRSTAAYAFRDVVAPLRRRGRPQLATVRSRLRAFASWLRWLPALLGDRRTIRSAAVRTDNEIESMFASTAEVRAE